MSRSWRHVTITAVVALALAVGVGTVPVAAQGDDPFIVAWIGGGSSVGLPEQFIGGQDYVIGELVDLYINDVYRATAEAEANAEGTGSPFFEVVFKAGDEIKLVRLSNGSERVLVAHDLAVGWSSWTFDTIAGSAEPGSEVLVTVGFSFEIVRTETVDSFGNFLADFDAPGDPGEPIYDLSRNELAAALQFDDDGDVTGFFAPASDTIRAECLNGGWQSLVRADGTTFRNQGECIAYFVRGR